MSKKNQTIASPDDLNKHLQHTSFVTWAVLILVIGLLIAFFTWGFLARLPVKLIGSAKVLNHQVTLNVNDSDLSKLQVGQKVIISDKEGEIIEFTTDTHQPVVSDFELPDGDNYTYTIILKEIRPIDFLIGR